MFLARFIPCSLFNSCLLDSFLLQELASFLKSIDQRSPPTGHTYRTAREEEEEEEEEEPRHGCVRMMKVNGYEDRELQVEGHVQGLQLKRLDDGSKQKPAAAAGSTKAWNIIALRVVAIVLSISGLVVMDTDEQLGRTPLYIPYLNSDMNIPKKAYYSLFTSFKYLVWANAVAAVVALVQLIIVVAISRQSKAGGWITLLVDQAVAYVLLAAAAASTEVAYVAKHGITYIGWNEQCSNYHRFCMRVGISLVLTYMATLMFAILTLMSAHRLFSLQSTKG